MKASLWLKAVLLLLALMLICSAALSCRNTQQPGVPDDSEQTPDTPDDPDAPDDPDQPDKPDDPQPSPGTADPVTVGEGAVMVATKYTADDVVGADIIATEAP